MPANATSVMAYIVMAYMVVAYMVMAYIVMAHMAYMVMACIVMACIDMIPTNATSVHYPSMSAQRLTEYTFACSNSITTGMT